MSTTVEKEWIAIPEDGEEEVVARGDTRSDLLDELGRKECPECGCMSMDPDGYVIMAVPKPHHSMFI